MPKPESATSIAEEAARWAVRAAYGDMTAENHAELDAWLAADRRHRGAYLRAQAGLIAMEDSVVRTRREPVPINDNAPSEVISARPRRWTGALFGAAAAACVAGAIAIGAWQARPVASNADAAREMTLADGSTVELGKGARVAARIDDNKRTVIVQSGTATFHVAHDRTRPFVVEAGQVRAQATGTIYSVKKIGVAGGAVAVKQGTVLVWAEGMQDRAVPLRAGEALTLDPASVKLSAARQGRASGPAPSPAEISLDNVSIAAAAARFNAVNPTKVIVEDPRIANMPVVGLFDAGDPEGFARAAAAVTGARVVRREGRIVIEM